MELPELLGLDDELLPDELEPEVPLLPDAPDDPEDESDEPELPEEPLDGAALGEVEEPLDGDALGDEDELPEAPDGDDEAPAAPDDDGLDALDGELDDIPLPEAPLDGVDDGDDDGDEGSLLLDEAPVAGVLGEADEPGVVADDEEDGELELMPDDAPVEPLGLVPLVAESPESRLQPASRAARMLAATRAFDGVLNAFIVDSFQVEMVDQISGCSCGPEVGWTCDAVLPGPGHRASGRPDEIRGVEPIVGAYSPTPPDCMSAHAATMTTRQSS